MHTIETNRIEVTVVPVPVAPPNLCSSIPASYTGSTSDVYLSFNYDSNAYTIYMELVNTLGCLNIQPYGMLPTGGMFVDIPKLSNFGANGEDIVAFPPHANYSVKYVNPYYYFQYTIPVNAPADCNGNNVSVIEALLFKTVYPCTTTALPLASTVIYV